MEVFQAGFLSDDDCTTMGRPIAVYECFTGAMFTTFTIFLKPRTPMLLSSQWFLLAVLDFTLLNTGFT